MEDIQHQQMGYDRAATMFAPDGHILQVEYAEKTVRLGSSSIGIVFDKGVILASDRRQKDSLIVEDSANKIQEIDDHLMVVSAGITSDARVLIDKARILCQQQRITYDSKPSIESIVSEIADIKQQFTQYGGARPFGVALMFAGIDSKPVIYTTDVTGNYLQYKANAIGEKDDKIKEILRQKYRKDMTKKEAAKLIIDIFKEIQGSEFKIERIDVGIIEFGKRIERLNGKDLEKI